jgi:hypothetical protein
VVGEQVVSVAVALAGDTHWMYWLAAQSEQGRELETGYLAVEALFTAAVAAGVTSVNLGASGSDQAPLEGVRRFKHRLGGIDVPVYEAMVGDLRTTARRLARRTARRLRRW